MTAVAFDAAALDWSKGDGLLPVVVQHAHDGRVLMLGYTDRSALERTLATGEVHFWSRSKQRLWRKGESSGHVLALVSLAADCDGDALLAQAVPAGPTCHRGTPSCFDGDAPAHPWLNELEALIAARAGTDPASSYVAKLLAGTPARRAQKVGEEGVEVALAAATGDLSGLRGEAADLVFHLLVLLRGAGLTLADVVGELARRHSLRGG
ncbi:bifunctional phosphoribosyl-AMP cyclohydrolase/phosphoribosyl-ATP diphosphatase HisIE [Dokdonella fugitiva]|jgi:phosphoribosyl-ATP pyrophosphohydrolase/phosphoribosyl-AMP cyclohydrolase|uniref:Histidine biosynthesis bifunctional protein HisIE n=1 Tax=Dokdonella fugitiva TaxID=328517 RepID=A0A4R2I5M3_9GAMM|nr:bifunctional phosphoribosyl-AMP cyclohydrolase/phosphoribosyl-ATP diphosphatase HisIE [Dokdonella fugitiva]MBA8884162.1 phosphoribosyl-ATP pyrophosphohydrolase/phosphoribosyl-AMP cyclohydrolase [Dokdonella fugitiva]TCO38849.1 phosphoribosyl-ATP pyrophosphatase /phosphoribosyl-AMP cyclohydrolase [Dokdonella fugitiva]